MFFPTGPLTTVYGLVLLFSVVACLWHRAGRSGSVAGAMFLSWIIALTTTYLDVLTVQVVGTFGCAAVALCARNRTGDIVALLFAFKLPFYAFHGASIGVFDDVENMWLASEIIAYIQIIIMTLGGVSDGGYRALWLVDSLAVPSRTGRRILALSAQGLKRMANSK